MAIDWDFDLLESLITDRGDEVIVETGVACTCTNSDRFASTIIREGKPASQPSLFCPICKGDGRIYRNARLVRGLVTSVTSQRNLVEMGYAAPGDSIFSPSLLAEPVSDFDKITMQYPDLLNDGQVIMRGAANLEENALLPTDLAVNEDRLWYLPDQAIWCEDHEGVVYSQGSDFIFSNKKIVWVGSSPDVGSLYTIKYTGFPEYIAYNSPQDRFDRNRNLGQKVILKRKHVELYNNGPDDSPATRAEEEASFTSRTKI